MKEITLFHSFNARNLSPKEVANSFIYNSQFDDLLQINHSLLLGPRGCGKTTLLKMLMPITINYWNLINNGNIKLPFYGIYIPTDNQWKQQFVQLENILQSSKDLCLQITQEIVNTNVYISTVYTFHQLIEIENRDDERFLNSQRNLCIDLIDIFNLKKPISPDIMSIQLALKLRISEINNLINKEKFLKELDPDKLPEYFKSNFFDLVSSALTAFKKNFYKDKAFEQSHFRWALCFDELELAPEWLQENLIEQLRSRADQTILYKLTSTPIVKSKNDYYKEDKSLDASELNDFNIIRAWTYNQNELSDWNNFAEKLAAQKIREYFNSETSPEGIFDTYNIEKVISDLNFKKNKDENYIEFDSWKKNYSIGTPMYNVIKYLALNDSSFKALLKLKEIEPTNPVPKNPSQLDSLYRKMKPIVIYRSQFIRRDKIIGRKNIPFYFGVNNIYEICDGNPRFLTGLIDRLLKSITNEVPYLIKPEKQSEIIYQISSKYLDVISSHPDATMNFHGRNINLRNIIISIGDFFKNTFYGKKFYLDPIGTFNVDINDDHILKLIDLGLKLGVFVYMDPKIAFTSNGVKNKKFRITYLLYPYFHLPIREYGCRNLSVILKPNDVVVPTLFSPEEWK